MSKVTLKDPEVTGIFPKYIRVENQNSPNLENYVKILDDVFRHDGGSEILRSTGFICYVAFDRSIHYYDLRYLITSRRDTRVRDRVHAEELISQNFEGRLWVTYLKGQRHDYYFYSNVSNIEESIRLIEVARVMVS